MKILLSLMAFICLMFPVRLTEPYEDLPWPKHDERIAKLAAYFKKHNCPQLIYVKTYIAAADKYDLPFELLPAISMQEQSCGKIVAYCRPGQGKPYPTNNIWGWNSAKYPQGCFKSVEEGIDIVANALANSKYYSGKPLEAKLRAYNSENPNYGKQILLNIKNINQGE